MLSSIIAPTVIPRVECLESDVEFWEEKMVEELTRVAVFGVVGDVFEDVHL